MSRLIIALTILIVALAACAPAASVPSPSPVPSQPPVTASPPPAESPAPTPQPSDRPSPTPAPVVTPQPTPAPTPEPVKLTATERYLIDGIRRTAIDCRRSATTCPGRRTPASSAVRHPAVARMGFYLFHNDRDMLDACSRASAPRA